MFSYLLHKVSNMPQQTRIPVDAIAVASGFAVWSKDIPVWVGIFTIVWLGMQAIIHLPRMIRSVMHIYYMITGNRKKCKCELCKPEKNNGN